SAPLPVKMRFLGLSDTLLTALRTRPDTSIAPRLRHESQMTVTYMTTKQNSARRSTLTDQRQAPLRSNRNLRNERPPFDAAPSPIGDPGHSGRANRAPTSSATGAGLRSRSDRQ